MFSLASITSTFTWPVKLEIPVDNKQLVIEFDAKFLRIDQDELDQRPADSELVLKVWQGWETDLNDENGKPMKWSPETRDRVLKIPGMRLAIAVAYLQAMSGAARVKN